MTTQFISDLHLEDSRPESTELLLRLLAGPARDADAFYVLGDLFEFWIGDDAVSATAERVAEAFYSLVGAGVPCYFQHGNRDFLLGSDYAARAQFCLLPEAVVLDLYGTPSLLMHGDQLCTDDVEYQAFRKQVRDPDWQAIFLSRSLDERLEIARQARDESRKHTAAASMEIMDVNNGAVLQAFHDHKVHQMIHGHTHRPAFHDHVLEDGSSANRIVLADWYQDGSVLLVSPDGVAVETLSL